MKHNILILAAIAGLLFGCAKDKDLTGPVISLNSGSEYTANGSVVKTGGALRFGIIARPGNANITNLVIKKITPDGKIKVVLDSGMNSSGFSVNKIFYQNIEDTAKWIFQIMDKNRLFASTSITLYKDPHSAWGGILEYPGITMGYQANTTVGQFLCCATGKVFKGDSAGMAPDSIDIATYYLVDDNLPSPTFSSPGEYGGGIVEYYPFINSWKVKNYTKWDISVDSSPIPLTSYDACHNDSLLIVSYDDVWGKRKFKWATAGKVIPFLTAKGKKGLIHVISADENTQGTITFSMKVQQ
ncbi:MAG: hypothetical protein Q8867_09045 [Bacteroidota bacterium]|nr:hypothetical protein [Bacteroidota bacterium]